MLRFVIGVEEGGGGRTFEGQRRFPEVGAGTWPKICPVWHQRGEESVKQRFYFWVELHCKRLAQVTQYAYADVDRKGRK